MTVYALPCYTTYLFSWVFVKLLDRPWRMISHCLFAPLFPWAGHRNVDMGIVLVRSCLNSKEAYFIPKNKMRMQRRMLLFRSYYKVQAFVVMNGTSCRDMFREKLYSVPENYCTTSLKKCMGRDSLLLFQHIALIKHLYMQIVVLSAMKRSWQMCVNLPEYLFFGWWKEKEWISHWNFKACLISYCLFTITLGGMCMYFPHDTVFVGGWYRGSVGCVATVLEWCATANLKVALILKIEVSWSPNCWQHSSLPHIANTQ